MLPSLDDLVWIVEFRENAQDFDLHLANQVRKRHATTHSIIRHSCLGDLNSCQIVLDECKTHVGAEWLLQGPPRVWWTLLNVCPTDFLL